jgi:hypothetical protein
MNGLNSKRLFSLSIGLTIFIGIPFLFGQWWLLASWIPALMAMFYLDFE